MFSFLQSTSTAADEEGGNNADQRCFGGAVPKKPLLTPSASSGSNRFEDHLFQGRVQLLRRLYSGQPLSQPAWVSSASQDDSSLALRSVPSSSSPQPPATPLGYFPPALRRRGSCESGFFSSVSYNGGQSVTAAAADFFLDSELSSTRYIFFFVVAI